MQPIVTSRLSIRQLTLDDAPFILKLLNDPGWLQFIGDKGVRTEDDARTYLTDGPIAAYARDGMGLWLVQRKEDGAPLGMCGLIRRPGLPNVDLGYAFMPEYRGQGYAFEAGQGCMAWGRETMGLSRIVAITDLDNVASGQLLQRLGFVFSENIRLSADGPEIKLFVNDPGPA